MDNPFVGNNKIESNKISFQKSFVQRIFSLPLSVKKSEEKLQRVELFLPLHWFPQLSRVATSETFFNPLR